MSFSVSSPGGGSLGDSISNAEIEDDAVTQAKIANDAVGSAQLDGNSVNSSKIENGSITAADLGFTVGFNLAGVSSIATEETTTSTTFVTLTTPDQVADVVVPASGLLMVYYRALWKLTGAEENGEVAIFLGSDQVKKTVIGAVPAVAAATLASTGDFYGPLGTSPVVSSGVSVSASTDVDTSLVGTGQVVGTNDGATIPVIIEADPGTYTVSVRYHVNVTDGGTLSVKDRKLLVWTPSS